MWEALTGPFLDRLWRGLARTGRDGAEPSSQTKSRGQLEEALPVKNEPDAAERAANLELLTACRGGTLAEVQAAVQKGTTNVNAANDHGMTGLMWACSREPKGAVVDIVKLLLHNKASVSAPDKRGLNAVHFACQYSSAEVVRLLLQADKIAARRGCKNGRVGLMMCMSHPSVGMAISIATVLLSSGCSTEETDSKGSTVLMYAATYSRPQMVSFLISRGADVRAKNLDFETALHFASSNVVFAREVILILCAVGADATAKSSSGLSGFESSLMRSKAVADAMAPFLPAGFKQDRFIWSPADMLGSMTCAVKFGAPMCKFPANALLASVPSASRWALVRNGKPLLLDGSDNDVFRVLALSKDAGLWKWASSEPQMQQHPITGDTMFHLLCRSDALDVPGKLVVLADLKKHYRNPLVPNYRNEQCVGLAREPELKKALQDYACWRPKWRVMEWFGPFFQRRAWALLLVCYRLKKNHRKALAGLNRDLRHLLVRYASRIEYIYVATKLRGEV